MTTDANLVGKGDYAKESPQNSSICELSVNPNSITTSSAPHTETFTTSIPDEASEVGLTGHAELLGYTSPEGVARLSKSVNDWFAGWSRQQLEGSSDIISTEILRHFGDYELITDFLHNQLMMSIEAQKGGRYGK